MDFEFNTTNVCCDEDTENEYHLEFIIDSLTVNDEINNDVQIILIFGDLVNKFDYNVKDGPLSNVYIVHSIPPSLSAKLLETPIMCFVISKNTSNSIGKIFKCDFQRKFLTIFVFLRFCGR